MIKRVGASLAILGVLLAGCGNPTPPANPDGPVLTGFNSMPKALATVYISPTPNLPERQVTLTQRPTETLAPPTLTPTPTVYLGVFMGDRTLPPGTVGFQATAPRGPLVVTLAPGAVTRTAASGGGAPIRVTQPAGAARNCPMQPGPAFAAVASNPAIQQRLGCPTAPSVTMRLVSQPFQTGFMFWRETKEIFALSTAAFQRDATVDTYWRLTDTWNESLPASDPGLVAPPGLIQPVRGFGFAWRSNPAIRAALGWALSSEQVYDAAWEEFERGWMMTGPTGAIFALSPSDPPTNSTGVHFGLLGR